MGAKRKICDVPTSSSNAGQKFSDKLSQGDADYVIAPTPY